MRVSFIILMILIASDVTGAEQQTTEIMPDTELLEFLSIFEQQDTDYVDEIIDEQQNKKTEQNSNGEQHEN